MLFFLNFPVKIIQLLESNTTPGEIASGVCFGLLLGFMPLNGPMAIVLFLCFFLFKINRLTAMLTLPLFKLIYILGGYKLTDIAGTYLLVDVDYLAVFWSHFLYFPVITYLDINNTLVAGGLVFSFVASIPIYVVSRIIAKKLKEQYSKKLKNTRFVKWFKRVPILQKILSIAVKQNDTE
ncbi:hypothetical protein OMAG_002355 [Candidatus Omnitrophus magneticus]|uniref:DUF2062 domain-containing protein n=1 Tax=Candidatus Omnitrophus magneticus TaxID=1609969 RepID=A0A0F0CKD9_9BACT|nr:hypothetical protein OMAG_002355 [Candidatus Omnitrophus magneticus]